jgi:hypothetical protein
MVFHEEAAFDPYTNGVGGAYKLLTRNVIQPTFH